MCDNVLPQSELSVAQYKRWERVTNLGDAIDQYFSRGVMRESYTRQQQSKRLLDIWLACNGDMERAHTVATAESISQKTAARTLNVYVDSPTCAVEFSCRQRIYLERLRSCGQDFDTIAFVCTKSSKQGL